jgi:hypothetical protein
MIVIVNAPTAAFRVVNYTNVESRRVPAIGTAPRPNTRPFLYLDLRTQTFVASDTKGAKFI